MIPLAQDSCTSNTGSSSSDTSSSKQRRITPTLVSPDSRPLENPFFTGEQECRLVSVSSTKMVLSVVGKAKENSNAALLFNAAAQHLGAGNKECAGEIARSALKQAMEHPEGQGPLIKCITRFLTENKLHSNIKQKEKQPKGGVAKSAKKQKERKQRQTALQRAAEGTQSIRFFCQAGIHQGVRVGAGANMRSKLSKL